MTDLTPEALGFAAVEGESRSWTVTLGDRPILLRSLLHLEELEPIDDIQRETLGTTDYDLIPASELVVAPETGGYVLAAYDVQATTPDRMLAAGFSWGGFVDGRPRLVSDFLGVRQDARSIGIGQAMKRLQAAIASQAGFEEIVWTVDPLRAANARLNFARLGAVSHQYERNRYGESFGESHYGGIPTDRLHMSWQIRDPRVVHLLLGSAPQPSSLLAESGEYRAVAIPDNIDRVLSLSRADALSWRMRVRGELEALFADGWQVDEFAPAGVIGDDPALVLHRRAPTRVKRRLGT